MCPIKNKSLSYYSSVLWSCIYFQGKWMAIKELVEDLQKSSLTWKIPSLFFSWPRQIKYPEVQPSMSRNFPLGSWFRWILRFSTLKASVDFPQLMWPYVLLLHNSLVFHPEENVRLLTSWNLFSLHWGIRIRNLHSSKLINMEHWKDILNSWRHVITRTS